MLDPARQNFGGSSALASSLAKGVGMEWTLLMKLYSGVQLAADEAALDVRRAEETGRRNVESVQAEFQFALTHLLAADAAEFGAIIRKKLAVHAFAGSFEGDDYRVSVGIPREGDVRPRSHV